MPPFRFLRLLIFLVPGLLAACSSAQNKHVASANPAMTAIGAVKASAPSKPSLPPPLCPPAGLLPLQSSSATGHHKVTLTWSASLPSSTQDGDAVGYCLYRSKKQHAAKKNPTCASCERVNSVPVSNLNCIDDLVQDGATYYYVVTAINPASRISSSSNEITASIPGPGPLNSTPSLPLASPSCRLPPAGK
jgi:hypothetical protein